ncbi:putative bifunctional diguanylate cyclase/phosphodiesterase [Paenibacillus methanolicus]|uniref:Diguanylate cyclase (GGDEF)-like protein n=1 Tax=Paenibacillus methanolicus TaxID=582686 RepID=A0A5S5BUE7_9BACL|nr:bifunctional diguanylate cyclase/phosphodiesterase [Paenibacillus methanolicus]TYP70795.1 diguanylate cyclase (GGDEF)-like protein [Paenibacillus methanolicus]
MKISKTNRRILLLLFAIAGYTGLHVLFINTPSILDRAAPLAVALPLMPPLAAWVILRRIAAGHEGGARRFWQLLGLSCLFCTGAQLVWGVLYLEADGVVHSPNYADFLWNLQSFTLVAAFVYLFGKHRNKYRGIRYLLDTMTVIMVGGTLFWVYVVSPGLWVFWETKTVFEFLITALYPVYDFLALAGLAALFFGYRTFLSTGAWLALAVALLLFGIADGIYALLTHRGGNFSESWTASLLGIGLLLFPLAGMLPRGRPESPPVMDEELYSPARSQARTFLPAVSIVVLIGCALDQIEQWNGVMIGGALTVAIIVIRQMVVLRENEALVQQSRHLLERYEYLANHDPLSNLPNRRYFELRVEETLARREEQEAEARTVVIIVDLDRFKYANDTYGHAAGDRIICQVAERLSAVVGNRGVVARQSGDEFAILLEGRYDRLDLQEWAQRLQRSLSRPFHLAERVEFLMTASLGITVAEPGEAASDLMRNVDLALDKAKSQGGGKAVFYTEELSEAVTRKLEMEQALRRALEQDELRLHYQPQVSAQTERIVGAEALIRWQPRSGAMISPAAFIPIAEETGLIVPIGEWVIRTACLQALQWFGEGLDAFQISVNVSSRQFQEADFAAGVLRIVEETGLPPDRLVLEITESIAIQDEGDAIVKLLAIKNAGIQIAMDDFGTGYSSLGVLKRFKVDKLKIDQTFVRDIGGNEEQATIVEAILAMASSLKMEVIAEGVETAEQYRFLQARGCGWIQGYYFSKPLPADQFGSAYVRKR